MQPLLRSKIRPTRTANALLTDHASRGNGQRIPRAASSDYERGLWFLAPRADVLQWGVQVWFEYSAPTDLFGYEHGHG